MPHWSITYGCNNYFVKGNSPSWHRLPWDDQERLSKWLAKFEESATPVSRGFFGDHFETSCLIKCSGSSRKNLRSGSVLIKFYFVQEKPARKPPAVRENKLKQSEAIRNLPKMHMEITPHSASTTKENLGDAENLNWNFWGEKWRKIGAAIRKWSFSWIIFYSLSLLIVSGNQISA